MLSVCNLSCHVFLLSSDEIRNVLGTGCYLDMLHTYGILMEYFYGKIFLPPTMSVKCVCILGSNCLSVYTVNERTRVRMCVFVCVVHFTLVLFVYLSIIRLLAAASVTHCCTRTERSPGHTHLRRQPRYGVLW